MSAHAMDLVGVGLLCLAAGFVAGVTFVAYLTTRRNA